MFEEYYCDPLMMLNCKEEVVVDQGYVEVKYNKEII